MIYAIRTPVGGGGGHADAYNGTTGLEENLSEFWLQIYPNPVNDDILVLQTNQTDEYNWEITEMSAKVLLRGNSKSRTNQIDLKSLADEIYYVHFLSANQNLDNKIVLVI